ncbi:hypothetical protein MPER_03566, partial [Moniliophthora perniciosa FA553]
YRCCLKDVQSVHGTLCHCSFVYLEGRTYLSSASNFAASFPSDLAKRKPPPDLIEDLIWWRDMLEKPGFYRQLYPRREIKDLGLYVDASTDWGIGVVMGRQWAAYLLVPDWKQRLPGRDICWLETVALELLISFLTKLGHLKTRLLVHSDNQGTIGAFHKFRSPNKHINLSLRRMFKALELSSIDIELIYVNTKDNVADPVSRGIQGDPELIGLASTRVDVSPEEPRPLETQNISCTLSFAFLLQ